MPSSESNTHFENVVLEVPPSSTAPPDPPLVLNHVQSSNKDSWLPSGRTDPPMNPSLSSKRTFLMVAFILS